jgi:hypothetical protein
MDFFDVSTEIRHEPSWLVGDLIVLCLKEFGAQPVTDSGQNIALMVAVLVRLWERV